MHCVSNATGKRAQGRLVSPDGRRKERGGAGRRQARGLLRDGHARRTVEEQAVPREQGDELRDLVRRQLQAARQLGA